MLVDVVVTPGPGTRVVLVDAVVTAHTVTSVRLQARMSWRRPWRFAFLNRIGARDAAHVLIASTQAGLQTARRSA